MKKFRQPPIHLMRVLRAIAGLRDNNGVTVSQILKQIQEDMNDECRPIRYLTMHVRRALSYAVDIGVLKHKAGKYRMVRKGKVYPIDSLEYLLDPKNKKESKRKYTKKKDTVKKKQKKHAGIQNKYGSLRRRKTRTIKDNLRIEKKESSEHTIGSEDQDDDLNINPIDGPSDKNKDLNRNTPSTTQTSYPSYKEIMPGDDLKTLDNVPHRPRRKRPSVLPVSSQMGENNQEGNNTINAECNLLKHLQE